MTADLGYWSMHVRGEADGRYGYLYRVTLSNLGLRQ
jgi:hypothetical protein